MASGGSSGGSSGSSSGGSKGSGSSSRYGGSGSAGYSNSKGGYGSYAPGQQLSAAGRSYPAGKPLSEYLSRNPAGQYFNPSSMYSRMEGMALRDYLSASEKSGSAFYNPLSSMRGDNKESDYQKKGGLVSEPSCMVCGMPVPQGLSICPLCRVS